MATYTEVLSEASQVEVMLGNVTIARACEYGKMMKKIAKVEGQTDDVLIINSVNVLLSVVETVILSNPMVGNNY